MPRSPERIKAPVGGRKWKREKRKHWKKGRKQNSHYSEKPGHAQRSVANDPHKSNKEKRGW